MAKQKIWTTQRMWSKSKVFLQRKYHKSSHVFKEMFYSYTSMCANLPRPFFFSLFSTSELILCILFSSLVFLLTLFWASFHIHTQIYLILFNSTYYSIIEYTINNSSLINHHVGNFQVCYRNSAESIYVYFRDTVFCKFICRIKSEIWNCWV